MAQIAFTFPGQGAYLPGALTSARRSIPATAELIETINDVAVQRLERRLDDAIDDPKRDVAELNVSDPALLQLGIFTISVGAFRLLETHGIRADLLIGHSFGEIAALTCAGVYTVSDGAHIVCDRIEALAASAPPDGCMAAISAAPDTVRALLTECAATTLSVAVENHQNQTVISGPRAEMDGFLARCRQRKLSVQMLHAPYGFHHAALAPTASAFATRLSVYPKAAPAVPVYSPILRRYYRADDDFGACLARHLVMPVAFMDAVQHVHGEGVEVFIECGALDGLTRIVGRILGTASARSFATFTPANVEDAGITSILSHIKETQHMNVAVKSLEGTEFDSFWRERGPVMLDFIKSEFSGFLMRQQQLSWTPVQLSTPEPAPLRRADLFAAIVAVYAEAMEYPPEVFTEAVELEAELGIDSVKQTEIMGRISETYQLPRLPANVRISDFRTMGQIVDLVFANQGKAQLAA